MKLNTRSLIWFTSSVIFPMLKLEYGLCPLIFIPQRKSHGLLLEGSKTLWSTLKSKI